MDLPGVALEAAEADHGEDRKEAKKMGYKVDYAALDNQLKTFLSAFSTWSSGISATESAAADIAASTNISGNSADRMRAYLNMVYPCASTSFSTILATFQENFLRYRQAYRDKVDSADDTYIDVDVLEQRSESLQEKRSHLRELALSAETTIKSVSDIVSVSTPDISAADEKFGSVLTSIEELGANIEAVESEYSSGDGGGLDDLISQLGSYCTDLRGQSEEFKTTFTMETFAAVASVSRLISALNSVNEYRQANSSEAAAAAESWQDHLDAEQAELEKREEQAKWAKVGFNFVVSAVSTVATLALTPYIGPAAGVLVGTISGGLKAAFSEAMDQYAENGWNMEEWDVNGIMVHGWIGTVSGMVGGMIPSGTGIYAKSTVDALSSAFEGAVSTSYDQLADTGSITDVGEIVEDALLKGTSSFFGSALGGSASDWLGDKVKSDLGFRSEIDYIANGNLGKVVQVEIASKLGSGIVDRFSSKTIEETGGVISDLVQGKSLEEAYSEHNVGSAFTSAFEPSSLVGDVGDALTSEDVITEVTKVVKGSRDNSNSEEYDRMMEKLAEMDARGEDAENYEIFGDPRKITSQRQAAVKGAWEDEAELVAQGKGTRDWSVSQQEELLRTGKVSGFEGQHMMSVSENADLASNPDNIQFLTYEEHLYGAHDGNFKNSTSGRYDPETGETETMESTDFLPHRNLVAQELSQKFDYTQKDLAEQLGSDFGYGRGTKTE